MAQQQSEIMSLSLSFYAAMAWQRMGMAYCTASYLGSGVPLHRLDKAQQQCLIWV